MCKIILPDDGDDDDPAEQKVRGKNGPILQQQNWYSRRDLICTSLNL